MNFVTTPVSEDLVPLADLAFLCTLKFCIVKLESAGIMISSFTTNKSTHHTAPSSKRRMFSAMGISCIMSNSGMFFCHKCILTTCFGIFLFFWQTNALFVKHFDQSVSNFSLGEMEDQIIF